MSETYTRYVLEIITLSNIHAVGNMQEPFPDRQYITQQYFQKCIYYKLLRKSQVYV